MSLTFAASSSAPTFSDCSGLSLWPVICGTPQPCLPATPPIPDPGPFSHTPKGLQSQDLDFIIMLLWPSPGRCKISCNVHISLTIPGFGAFSWCLYSAPDLCVQSFSRTLVSVLPMLLKLFESEPFLPVLPLTCVIQGPNGPSWST